MGGGGGGGLAEITKQKRETLPISERDSSVNCQSNQHVKYGEGIREPIRESRPNVYSRTELNGKENQMALTSVKNRM